jgi:DNA ligase 1
LSTKKLTFFFWDAILVWTSGGFVLNLPVLYKADSSGSLRIWMIRTEGNEIITEHGQIGGAIQTSKDVIKVGKNIGKKNETSPEQQADAEALSKWEKQKSKKGYVEDKERAAAEENDTQGEECMLAHTYGTLENGVFVPDQNKKIKFPAYVQPKFDGYRCRTKSDKTLWSRGHKPILQMPHVVAAIQKLFPKDSPKLDGELYNHELKEDFEKLSSILRQQKSVHPEHELMQYHVYDVDEPGLNFEERHKLLQDMLEGHEILKVVETRMVNNHEEVLAAYEDFIARGYEGLIIRNIEGEYEGKRSYNLQKLKGFRDREFQITGIKEGKGKLMGHAATFTCLTDEGKEFDVKLEGPTEKLKQHFENHSLWQGKSMTVRHVGWTKKKVPKTATGLRIREDI